MDVKGEYRDGERLRREEGREREKWRGVCDGWDCALPEAFLPLRLQRLLYIFLMQAELFFIFSYTILAFTMLIDVVAR
jgi:hypothetical protein